jgi:hypothetical protein
MLVKHLYCLIEILCSNLKNIISGRLTSGYDVHLVPATGFSCLLGAKCLDPPVFFFMPDY